VIFWGQSSHPREPIGVKFRVTKWTHVPLGLVKFYVNLCNKSPLRGENAYFWRVSKFYTGSLLLKSIQTPHFRTYSRRA